LEERKDPVVRKEPGFHESREVGDSDVRGASLGARLSGDMDRP